MARAWIELTGEQAGWGPARLRVAGLGRAGYVCEVLAGSGPLVLVLTGRKLSVSELLAIGGPPARRYDPGRFPGLRRHYPRGGAAPFLWRLYGGYCLKAGRHLQLAGICPGGRAAPLTGPGSGVRCRSRVRQIRSPPSGLTCTPGSCLHLPRAQVRCGTGVLCTFPVSRLWRVMRVVLACSFHGH